MAFVAAAFGLIVGSFANVVILRQNTGERISSGRSRCFACGKKLEWYELVPIFSFLIQKGRCGGCKSGLSFQYPLVEAIFGIVYLLFFLRWSDRYGDISQFYILGFWYLIGFILIVLAVYDAKHFILPDKFTYSLILISVLGSIFFAKSDFYSIALSLVPAIFLALLWFISRGCWMGLGDAKLIAGGGIFLGWLGAISALLWAFWLGAAYGLILILFKHSATLKSEIPFGPFLILGVFIAFFFPDILNPIFSVLSYF
jgi:prepilin signal peptidase PulO-like enzyme (type II secretory pathway)